MKKKMTIVVSILMALMIAACGGNSTPAQETSDKPAAEAAQDEKQEAEAEAAQDEKQEAEAEAAQDEVTVQESEAAEAAPESTEAAEVKIDDPTSVYYWRIKDGKLEGLIGPNQFGIYEEMELPEEVNDEATVCAFNDDKTMILLKQGPSLYQIDFANKQYSLLNEGAIDSRYDQISGICYFYSADHMESYISDWRSPNVITTSNPVENYVTKEPTLEWGGFDEGYWSELQDYVKNGEYVELDDQGLYVTEEGEVYDYYAERVSNIHCPTAMPEYTFGKDNSAIVVKDNQLKVYQMGEEIMSVDLNDGVWTTIAAVNDSILLYNADDRAIYKVENNEVKELYTNISDLEVVDTKIYFASDNTGYVVSSWIDETEPESIVDGVLGVSHFVGLPGFCVSEGGNINHNGVDIVTE